MSAVTMLKGIKKRRDWNNTDLAKALDVQLWTVGAWISGKRGVCRKNFSKIKRLYETPVQTSHEVSIAIQYLNKMSLSELAEITLTIGMLMQKQIGAKNEND